MSVLCPLLKTRLHFSPSFSFIFDFKDMDSKISFILLLFIFRYILYYISIFLVLCISQNVLLNASWKALPLPSFELLQLHFRVGLFGHSQLTIWGNPVLRRKENLGIHFIASFRTLFFLAFSQRQTSQKPQNDCKGMGLQTIRWYRGLDPFDSTVRYEAMKLWTGSAIVGVWWYWVSVMRHRLILDGTGSV